MADYLALYVRALIVACTPFAAWYVGAASGWWAA